MDAYARLLAAGIRPDCAADTIQQYRDVGDYEGLERYISSMENKQEVSDR